MSRSLKTETVVGDALSAYVDDLARLRISVFREYPYLYDGDQDYELRYLQTYLRSGAAMAVLAFDEGAVVGASTGIPMAAESDEFKAPFVERGLDPDQLFYCGESVLLPAYRGRGLYKAFFHGREAHAAALGRFRQMCFCAVLREQNDVRRPADYVPLDPVWRHFGYAPMPDLVAHYAWKEVGAEQQTEHAMMFWLKNLAVQV